MFHTSRTATPTMPTRKVKTTRRVALLFLFAFIALAGVVFSGSSVSVHSSDSMPDAGARGESRTALNSRDGGGGLPNAAAVRANPESQPGTTLAAAHDANG